MKNCNTDTQSDVSNTNFRTIFSPENIPLHFKFSLPNCE